MSTYAPIPAQIAANYATARQEVLPGVMSVMDNQRQIMLDQPVLYWRKEYETHPELLYQLYQHISDFQLLNPHPLYAWGNVNQAYLYGVAEGKMRRKDYEPLMKIFGDEGSVPLKDPNFFNGAIQSITSQVLRQPFDFSVRNVNTVFGDELLVEESKKSASMGGQALLQAMMAGGDGGVAPAVDKSVKLPISSEDWINYATGEQQLEGIIYDLLLGINNETPFADISRQAVRHKFKVNAEAGFISVRNGHVIPQAVHPHMVRWLAGKPVTTLSDPAVLGCQYNSYMTYSEIVNRFGTGFLDSGSGVKGLLAYFDTLRGKKSRSIGYDPQTAYLTAQNYSAAWAEPHQYSQQQVNWMNGLFYPTAGGLGKLLINVLVQPNFFTMFREKRFVAEKVDRHNTRTPATDREIQAWREERTDTRYEIDFTPIGDDEKAGNRNVKTYVKPQMWSFTRIGHGSYVDCGPYRYQPDFETDTHERDRIDWPIKMQISYEKSMTKLGENDAILVGVLYQKAHTFIASMGYEEVLVLDDVHGKNPVSYLFNAKNTGILRFNSETYRSGNPFAAKHLETIKISNQREDIVQIFAQIDSITRSYEIGVGAGPDVQGQSSPYQSNKAQQQNLAGQQLLNIEFHYDHSRYLNQMLQGTADHAKWVYAVDREHTMRLGPSESKVLKLTRNLSIGNYSIYLESGALLKDKKKALDELVGQLMQRTTVQDAEALMEIILSNNPAKGVAGYRKVLGLMREREDAQGQQAQSAQQAQESQLDKKYAHEIDLALITADKDIYIAQIKLDGTRQTGPPPANLIPLPPAQPGLPPQQPAE